MFQLCENGLESKTLAVGVQMNGNILIEGTCINNTNH